MSNAQVVEASQDSALLDDLLAGLAEAPDAVNDSTVSLGDAHADALLILAGDEVGDDEEVKAEDKVVVALDTALLEVLGADANLLSGEDVAPVNAPAVAAQAEPKPERRVMPRNAFAASSERIAFKLGDRMKEFLVLDIADAALSDAELVKKQKALLLHIDTKLAMKVAEKATMLLGYLANGGKMNEVMKRAFVVLLKDGQLTSGDKGNLVTNLLAKPYSIGTARSQSNQIFSLFPLLGICNAKSGSSMTLNENSTIVAKMKQELGL